MTDESKKLQDILDELSKDATHIIGNPSTVKKLQDRGLPVINTFTTFEEYIDKLFDDKKKAALELVKQLPFLDNSIANGVIAEIYDEIRASYTLGIFTSTIFNSILLLEFAMRDRIYQERLKHDPNSKWENLEKLDMDALIQQLFKLKVITNKQKETLGKFSANFRNPYFHINIQKMSEGAVITKLPQVNTDTQEVIILRNVKASQFKFLWFAAKRIFDKHHVLPVVNFCVSWTNKLLKK